MTVVYLWDAGTWSGVSASLEDAQQRAAEHLGAGERARIESALLVTGIWSLSSRYEHTGNLWTSSRLPDGTLTWDPARRIPALEVSRPPPCVSSGPAAR
jgi:hypothetical protein